MTLSTADEHVLHPSAVVRPGPSAPTAHPWRMVITRLWRSRLSWSVAATTAARLIQMACQLVVSVMISRALGPAGRGVYATASVLTALGTSFGNLGLPAANTYEVARDRRQLSALLANSLGMACGGGLLLVCLLWLTGRWRPEILPGDSGLLLLALIGIPLGLMQQMLQHLLIGLERVRLMNLLTLVSAIVPLAAVAVLWMIGGINESSAFAVGLGVSGVTTLLMWKHLARLAPRPHRASLPLLRRSMSYGLRAYLTTLSHALVLRLDLLMVRAALGNEATGQYSTAAVLAEWAILVPSVAAMLLFPKVAAGADRRDQWALCCRAVPAYLIVMSVVTAAGAGLGRPAVALLYGEEFLPAAAVFLWMLPGVFFRGLSYPAYLFLGGIGRPLSHLVLCFGVLAANVAGNAFLIPRWGMQGAAAVSSASYLLGCAGGYWLARRHAHHRSGEMEMTT